MVLCSVHQYAIIVYVSAKNIVQQYILLWHEYFISPYHESYNYITSDIKIYQCNLSMHALIYFLLLLREPLGRREPPSIGRGRGFSYYTIGPCPIYSWEGLDLFVCISKKTLIFLIILLNYLYNSQSNVIPNS